MSEPDLTIDALPTGTVLGDYELIKPIGRGGFAITYLGRHRQLTRQLVAIKEYFPETLTRRGEGGEVRSVRAGFADGRREFLEEGQRLATLKHPNIVRVINFLKAFGTAYLIMEFEAGPTLEQQANRVRWEGSRLRLLAVRLLEALAAVHAAGLLHRDLNPSNILLRDDGAPVLIDFGAARSELARRSRAVTSVVTDGYSPVEQYGTQTHSQGPWTDLYALGATLYRLVTGERPMAASDRSDCIAEGGSDPLPSARQAGAGRQTEEFLVWIDTLLAVRRGERPQSADEALRLLRQMARATSETRGATRPVDDAERWDGISGSAGERDAGSAASASAERVASMPGSPRSAEGLTASADAQQQTAHVRSEASGGTRRVDETERWNAGPGGVSERALPPRPTSVRSEREPSHSGSTTAAARSTGATAPEPQRSRSGHEEVQPAGWSGQASQAPGTTDQSRSLLLWRSITVALMVGSLATAAWWVWSAGGTDAPPEQSPSDAMSPPSPTTVASRPADGVPPPLSGKDPEPLSRFRDCAECPEMVVIPAGTFTMGSPVSEEAHKPSEAPTREVRVASFAMGRTEVTFTEYDRFATATGRERPSDEGWGRRDFPVIHVSWEEASAYAQWLSEETGENYRLPSEAEWEYAARAGTAGPFSFEGRILPQKANYDSLSSTFGGRLEEGVAQAGFRKQTAPTGSLPSNHWGLHEVHGNVAEWVADCWHDNYAGAPKEGVVWLGGDCQFRVVRGGSWLSNAHRLRAAARIRNVPAYSDYTLGFRVARTLGQGSRLSTVLTVSRPQRKVMRTLETSIARARASGGSVADAPVDAWRTVHPWIVALADELDSSPTLFGGLDRSAPTETDRADIRVWLERAERWRRSSPIRLDADEGEGELRKIKVARAAWDDLMDNDAYDAAIVGAKLLASSSSLESVEQTWWLLLYLMMHDRSGFVMEVILERNDFRHVVDTLDMMDSPLLKLLVAEDFERCIKVLRFGNG